MSRPRRDWSDLIETLAWGSLMLPFLLVVVITIATAYRVLLP